MGGLGSEMVRWKLGRMCTYPRRLLGARCTHFFWKNRSEVELAQSQKKIPFQKVSKTKDLDMEKNFFRDAPWFSENSKIVPA